MPGMTDYVIGEQEKLEDEILTTGKNCIRHGMGPDEAIDFIAARYPLSPDEREVLFIELSGYAQSGS